MNLETKQPNFKEENGIILKFCSKCQLYFPMTDDFFYKRNNVKCGFDSYCKHCQKEKEAKEKREETPTYDYTEIDGWIGSLNDDVEPHTTLSSEGPRGKRNNNWMNLRIDPNSPWEGKRANFAWVARHKFNH